MAWYCWGSGGSGCLLLPNLDDFSTPQISLPELPSIACGGCHCLSVGEDTNTVRAWGANNFGQCGESPEQLIIKNPIRFGLPQKVMMVACGWRHSLFLFEDGRIASCGHKSVIGRSDESGSCYTVGVIDIPERITSISCGYDHSAAIGSSNGIWLWGSNKFGQIGVPLKEPRVSRPSRSDFPVEFTPVAVVCGLRHTAALTSVGTILTVGNNRFGQLGRCEGTPRCHKWNSIEIQNGIRFIGLSSGWSHCLGLSSENEAWTWGRGDLGQQGDGSLSHRWQPHRVVLPQAIGRVLCGSEHSVCIDATSTTAFIFGWNEHGNLGLGDQHNRSQPAELTFQGRKIAKFATSGAVCFAYIENNLD